MGSLKDEHARLLAELQQKHAEEQASRVLGWILFVCVCWLLVGGFLLLFILHI